jgi:hypothetical protein
MVFVMTQTTTLPDDLRHTAATVVAANLAAGGTPPAMATIEAGLAAATAFLTDAYLIEEAIAAATGDAPPSGSWGRQPRDVWQEAGGTPYRYLQLLQRRGDLRLRTVRLDDALLPDEEDH